MVRYHQWILNRTKGTGPQEGHAGKRTRGELSGSTWFRHNRKQDSVFPVSPNEGHFLKNSQLTLGPVDSLGMLLENSC